MAFNIGRIFGWGKTPDRKDDGGTEASPPASGSSGSMHQLRDILSSQSYWQSESGAPVTHQTALQASVVLACVDVIARGISQVPFNLMVKGANGMREEAAGHDLYWLLKRGPNPYMSDYDFRYTVAQHVALTGNAYVWLNRVGGKVLEMYPLHPDSVSPSPDMERYDGWRQRYRVTLPSGKYMDIPEEDMWVVKWRPYDGIFGLDPVRVAREAVGLSLSGERMAASIYKNGTAVRGYLTSEGRLSDEARAILRSEWERFYAGSSNAGRIPVLSGALKYNPIMQVSAQEAQLIDNRNFQIDEICRMWGVQPVMVYHYAQTSTYGSVEQMFLAHVIHTMSPWYRLFESSANKNLLSDEEFRGGHYFRFSDTGMLRGDMTAMSNWFKSNIEHGIMSPNDCREFLDLNPYPEGDIHLVPLNMSTPKTMLDTEAFREQMNAAEVAKAKADTAKAEVDADKVRVETDNLKKQGEEPAEATAPARPDDAAGKEEDSE